MAKNKGGDFESVIFAEDMEDERLAHVINTATVCSLSPPTVLSVVRLHVRLTDELPTHSRTDCAGPERPPSADDISYNCRAHAHDTGQDRGPRLELCRREELRCATHRRHGFSTAAADATDAGGRARGGGVLRRRQTPPATPLRPHPFETTHRDHAGAFVTHELRTYAYFTFKNCPGVNILVWKG